MSKSKYTSCENLHVTIQTLMGSYLITRVSSKKPRAITPSASPAIVYKDDSGLWLHERPPAGQLETGIDLGIAEGRLDCLEPRERTGD